MWILMDGLGGLCFLRLLLVKLDCIFKGFGTYYRIMNWQGMISFLAILLGVIIFFFPE